jgi:hypothetical protein
MNKLYSHLHRHECGWSPRLLAWVQNEGVRHDLVAALTDELPWLGLLPRDEIPRLVSDFVAATAEPDHGSVLAQTLREWKATADIHADPALVRRLSEPVSDDVGSGPGPAMQ